ncbi:Epidermal growth factor receptor substrate 15-like 1 [Hypsizygus marmoreus]|uniref:Epidermal growth factor receptor substrate 15-like 1 n=1 Tax=Hypsizygus marmoreus TaxID=39966 RepID=A0A369JI85_HYPMA|nr:Epidermal growth factor receptor substrate 15-like 1 [Hypsizygus marmoreus]
MSSKFSPSPAELALVSQIFSQADPQKLGILTGDVAVKVFGGAKLQPTVLGEIWSIADEDNNGWLPRKGVTIAVRLMGWAQKGERITQELVNKPGPLPTIEGITVVAQHNTGMSLPKSPPPGFPPFTAQEKAKFQNLFNKAGPGSDGLLSANKARDIFVKSKLSNDILLQIWNLADTQDRGALDSTDFAIGMYFIQGLMSGQLSFVPSTLPPGLYQQAGGLPSNQGSVRSHMSGNSNSGSFSPLSGTFPQNRSAIQPQYTGQTQLLQPDHTGYSAAPSRPPVLPARPPVLGVNSPPFVPQRNGKVPAWDVTPTEKANADRFFDDLDPQRRGYIEGDVAVPFMLKSNLPGEDLARVWDLADVNNDGKLTRDGFAVAMYLIQKKLAGIEIPTSLPASLMPPSVRASATSPFAPSPPQQQPEHARDLLWDDTPPASATTPQLSRQPEPATSAFHSVPFSAISSRDPFGTSGFVSTAHHDLLGDDDDVNHTSPPLHDQSAEIGNAQNQFNSTNRALGTLKHERATVEEALANQASQLSALQTQLSSAKAAYETETKLLATLRERHSTQTTEMQKAREELIRAESDLSAVRVEKSEVEGAFLRDKEDARELHRKMVDVGQQIEVFKSEVEKAKKDAKQQKGLLAIAKKQLSTKEAEKAKVEKELEEASAEVAALTTERNDAESELAALTTAPPVRALSPDSLTFAAEHPLPVSDPSSPTGSAAGKSNNPFERLAKSPGTPRSQSPFLPFSSSAILTPGVGEVPTTDTANSNVPHDPFGFAEAFETEAEPLKSTLKISETPGVVSVISRTSTPKPTPVDVATPNGELVLSPGNEEESDHFVTPPTTATIQRSQTSSPALAKTLTSPAAAFPALDDAASHFPDIKAEDAKAVKPPTLQADVHTDLGTQLKELDVNESDSDSDDEVPLAELAKAKENHLASPPPPALATKGLESQPVTFDDVFGVTLPTAAATTIPFAGDNRHTNGSPVVLDSSTDKSFSSSPTVAIQAEGPPVAGVNAFDEAMGTIPSSSAPAAQAFTFDSAFDDNFDFASATETSVPARPAPAPHEDKTEGFDSVFATPPKSGVPVYASHLESPLASSANGHLFEPSPNNATPKPTFDEAFMGFDSGPSLDLDRSFTAPKTQGQASPTQQILPTSSTSPKVPSSPPHSIAPRPVSPTVRTKSPPPRVSSPKPRPSTSSSKEPQEKPKDPPARHSKLSIRLPFGKKKKHQHQEPLPPAPAQHLTPPVEEEITRNVTPAVDDDVEAVKQLSAMGFSRSQAVNALERSGYDVQKALNSLLGAP